MTKNKEFWQKKQNLIQENQILTKEYENLETVITAQKRRNEIEIRQKEIADELLKIHVEFLKDNEGKEVNKN